MDVQCAVAKNIYTLLSIYIKKIPMNPLSFIGLGRQLAQTFSPKRNKRIDRGIFIYERCLWKAKKKSSY